MRRDQKGYTIAELLIAVAILSIVVVSVCGFILVGSRSYAAGNSDISVQQEAELALNQMSDVLIDTTRSVIYAAYDASGDPVTALKDAEFSFTPEDKSLIMFNGVVVKDPSGGPDTIEDGNGNKHYHFFWSKAKETLFYAEQDLDDPTRVDSTDIIDHFPEPADADPDADPAATGWHVLASHVTDFSVDLSQVEEKRVVQLALTFVDGTKEYVTSNNVTIRNKVGVNDAELAPLNKKVEIDITVKSSLILEPGETFVLPTPKVTGKNVTDKSVTWSLVNPDPADPAKTPKGSTLTTDGILTLSKDEIGSFIVRATTNAEDSDHNQSSADITVNVKRVTGIDLWKSYDSDPGNGPNEISPGCTFTVSGRVKGDFLDQTCDACGEDTSIDRHILSTECKIPGMSTDDHVWRVWDPETHDPQMIVQDPSLAGWRPREDIIPVDQDEYTATFKVEPHVSDAGDHGYVIQVMSLLSYYRPYGSPTYKGRRYDWVWPSISFKVVKSKEDAEPYGGGLRYGEQTLDESIREGLSTDHPKYATAIRVVDNSGKMPDRVLLYFTIGGGANYRICPDLFDLDLNGSYTFYMQAIDPVSKENREKYERHEVGNVIEDGADAIREEYFAHLDTKKPYGYVGNKYPHGKVFYAKLDRPKLIFKYQGVEYKGKNITYDPVNIYTVGPGSGIIGKIEPSGYESIESNQGMEGMVYSLYEGDGSNQQQWGKCYYYDQNTMSYQGSRSLADGAAEVNPGGDPFMKLSSDNNKHQVAGDYHVVPGMLYRNKAYDHYEIIGWQGFDYPNLPRNVRYYEFDESTIHVKVNGDFTMDLNHDRFRGQALFPLPGEMAKNPLFPDIRNLDWQVSGGKMWVTALRNGRTATEGITFTYVRYRYIDRDKAWEVEPVEVEYDAWNKKIKTYSYGIHKCGENDTKWWCTTPAKTTERDLVCNLEGIMVNGTPCKMYFPMPSEDAFPFQGGLTKISCDYTHQAYPMSEADGRNPIAWLEWNADVKYAKIGNKHRITFVKRNEESVKYGIFECSDGATAWTKVNETP